MVDIQHHAADRTASTVIPGSHAMHSFLNWHHEQCMPGCGLNRFPAMFVGMGLLLPRASTLALALLALTFAWAIEFSQLYHAPWIDAVRATLPGRLVLGATFNWPDLPAYALGIGLGAWAEWMFRRRVK